MMLTAGSTETSPTHREENGMEYFDADRNTLDRAVRAVRARGHFDNRSAASVSSRFHIATVRKPLAA
jgi:hypothetical protein